MKQKIENFLTKQSDYSIEIEDSKMAQEEGLEPPTQRLTAACSTD